MTRSRGRPGASRKAKRRPRGTLWPWALGSAAALLVVAPLSWVATQAVRRETKVYTDLPGIDLSGLPAADVNTVVALANRERCPCGCGYTLADCRHRDVDCQTSRPVLERLVEKYRGSGSMDADPADDGGVSSPATRALPAAVTSLTAPPKHESGGKEQ